MPMRALATAGKLLGRLRRSKQMRPKPANHPLRSLARGLETLENRDMNSVASIWLQGSTLVVQSDASASLVEVSSSGSNLSVFDRTRNASWNFAAAGVATVEFHGGAGNDRFLGMAGNVQFRCFGNGGNDYLEGGNLNDLLDGGAGDDRLVGNAGNDQLIGASGANLLLGGAGNDDLQGGAGDDRINGGLGNDRLFGGDGNDLLIAIDGANSDYLQGDAGSDTLWIDLTLVGDVVSGTTASDKVQLVRGFANGADRTLDGDRIVDPAVRSNQTYKTFANRPLFAAKGPAADDIRQGALGDCYLLAGLSAIAQDSPTVLRQNVVDFDDGTYGVRLGNSFYRVDNDLPVFSPSSPIPAFAQFGAEGSVWVAVVEKAFAHYRAGLNSYASIEGGWGVEANRAFGATALGNRDMQSYGNATALANEILARWAARQAVTIGFLGPKQYTVNTAPLVMGHMYSVSSVNVVKGQVTSIVLRNPWGIDGAGKDANIYDGLVTVTPVQLMQYYGRLNWGQV
ncbi:MAG: hypothetical protein FJ295_06305 [Planctomycetes bacterium]|nr:hypothetical protein [Planctomycetota bacterium]